MRIYVDADDHENHENHELTMIFFEGREKWQKFENDHEVLLERPWKSPKIPQNGPWKPRNDYDFFGQNAVATLLWFICIICTQTKLIICTIHNCMCYNIVDKKIA